ncbi:unnamed protein product [Adineta steineri]|uniref:Uncharacterized protein n=1 Tax=Adineta steineri TaxID=433720 RepID=A0A814L1Q5_9BILA|nr:unnamed protein product [Adineta steineri]CAF1126399.1 unnamed protein product [Adineta steineri]
MMRTNNFKNVAKTLATRYCLKQCFKSHYLCQLKDLIYPVGVKKTRTTCFNTAMKKLLVNDLGWNELDDNIIICHRLIYDTIEYCRSAVYVIDLLHFNEQPIFAQVVFIIKIDQKWWLLMDLLNTIAYNEDLFAWEIKSIDHYSIIDPSHDIDGKTLEMMSTVERISAVIPKFKQQLIFLEEREKLFKKISDCSVEFSNSSFSITTNSQPSSPISSNSQALFLESRSTLDVLPKPSIIQSSSEPSVIQQEIHEPLPSNYIIPTLPNALLNDITKGDLKHFGPHCANRQILIDTIVYDLIDKFNLFYPSHTQFDNIGTAIVKLLKLPVTKQNIAIWKDALQTKLKRKRTEHRDNSIVQEYQLKYSKSGSGRPVKRQLGETAQRDRYKQMIVVSFDDKLSNEIQTKSEQLRDTTDIDINTQLELWKETLPYRRKLVRDRSTIDILKDFPRYSNSIFVFEEVKMLMKIDLSAAIRRQVPILLDKIVKTPMFVTGRLSTSNLCFEELSTISDSLPIQLIKTLCRQFDETIQHIFSDTEPFTPYPTLVCVNDLIHVYVDFHLIVSTNSPDDALALLVSMYTIFELSFNKKSRTIRLIYSVLHGDKRFLPNSIRIFIKENNIDIYSEQQQSSLNSSNSMSNISTKVINESQESQSHVQITEQCNPLDRRDLSIVTQTTEENDSIDIVDSSSRTFNNTNECNNLVEVASSSDLNSQQNTTQQRKRPKRNRTIDTDNNSCSFDAEQSQHIIDSQKHKPLTDLTNSSSNTRQSKRQRRI